MGILIKVGEDRYRAESVLGVNEKDGTVMVKVPAGEFEMGDGEETNCPKHKVYVEEYWIGLYCVTNGQYKRFIRETGHRVPDKADYGDPVWKGDRYPEEKRDHPVVCVSWEDAGAYAQWAGCELPTEAQWEKAARGIKGMKYPWGEAWDEARCRNDKNKGNEETSEVWGYGKGVSGYGTYQQSGNVWEWCGDWYDEKYYTTSEAGRDPVGPTSGSHRVYRGGCWWNGDPSNFRGARRNGRDPGIRDDGRGFRLSRTAK